MRIAALSVMVLGLAGTANSADLAEYTVAQLLEPCIEGDNDSRWGEAAEAECEQYILGFTDAYVLVTKEAQKCLPALNRADEVRWSFMKWAHRNFSERHKPAAVGLLETIRTEYKCP